MKAKIAYFVLAVLVASVLWFALMLVGVAANYGCIPGRPSGWCDLLPYGGLVLWCILFGGSYRLILRSVHA